MISNAKCEIIFSFTRLWVEVLTRKQLTKANLSFLLAYIWNENIIHRIDHRIENHLLYIPSNQI